MTLTSSTPVKSDAAACGRILIVDDELRVRQFVERVLAEQGHTVDSASGTDRALERLAAEEYDVVLVDLDMPGRNGLVLLSEMRAVNCSAVPVLFTGTSQIAAAVEGMKRGAFDYIAKPPDLNALRWTVARAVDVAHSRRRERTLERVAAEWASTFDACPDLIMVLDDEGSVLRANEAVAQRVGASATELVGRRAGELFVDGLGSAIIDALKCLTTGRTAPTAKVFDAALDGYFLLSVVRIRSASGVIVVARDVTELVRAEEVRGRLLRQLLTAQEDERGRIARELHDGVGQALVSLAYGLSATVDASIGAATRDRLDRLGRLASETLEEIRQMAQSLRPRLLDDLGLVAALSRLTELFTQVHGVRAELVVPSVPVARLTKDIESALYRIAQEALANVAKHANARTVDVVLEVSDRSAHLTVSDDGTGFVPTHRTKPGSGFGLSDIRERAVLCGGQARIESVPGRGTTIDVRIPTVEGPP